MDKSVDKAIFEVLNEIGVAHSLKGYSYLVLAIKKCINDKKVLNGIVKRVYMELAEECDDDWKNVERSIGRAVSVYWERGNTAVLGKVFGYTVSSNKGRPTNSEFIAGVADFIAVYGNSIVSGAYHFS